MHQEGDLLPISEWQARRADALRVRMQEAGCVFEFTVRHFHSRSESPSETHHRDILGNLFRELSQQHSHDPSATDDDLTQARSTVWPSECITDPRAFRPKQRITHERDSSTVSPYEWLFQAFDNPPYGARCEPGLFAEFCEVVGLWPHRDIEVLDWVGYHDIEPERSNWSGYFDQGKEWWGIWCLTIWSPRERTLAALVASSTD